MRSPSYLSLAVLCLAACSVDVAGSMPGDGGEFWDGGGLDSGPGIVGEGGQTVDGAVESCTGVAAQTRLRFEQAQVVAPTVCTSETQKRTCSGGTYTAWSGTFAAETCELAPYASCGIVMHGAQETRTRYEAAVSVSGCKKQEQSRTCDDGEFDDWTGDYQVESCSIGFLAGCDLIGGSFDCEPGTTCMIKGSFPFSSTCLGGFSHACSANGECVSGTCLNGMCGLKSAPGGSCDEQSDCNGGCGNNNTVSCAQNSCRCSDTSSCTSNDQCLGTCVSNKCVQANTTCDSSDDCRDAYLCKTPVGRTKGCYLPDGQACSANASCEHVCRAAVCATAGAADQACDENVDCKSGLTCRATGKCAALSAVGEACEETADCQQTQLMPLVCAPYTAGAVTFQACLLASGAACGGSDVACASGVCDTSGNGNGTCQ